MTPPEIKAWIDAQYSQNYFEEVFEPTPEWRALVSNTLFEVLLAPDDSHKPQWPSVAAWRRHFHHFCTRPAGDCGNLRRHDECLKVEAVVEATFPPTD